MKLCVCERETEEHEAKELNKKKFMTWLFPFVLIESLDNSLDSSRYFQCFSSMSHSSLVLSPQPLYSISCHAINTERKESNHDVQCMASIGKYFSRVISLFVVCVVSPFPLVLMMMMMYSWLLHWQKFLWEERERERTYPKRRSKDFVSWNRRNLWLNHRISCVCFTLFSSLILWSHLICR